MRLVLDWDGTITERDTLHMAIEEFGDVDVFHALEAQIGRELTLNEVIAVEMETITAPFDAVLDWLLDTVVVRPGLPELVAAHDPLIISAGFHELIEPVLAREGVAATVVANRDRGRPDRLALDLPRAGGRARCAASRASASRSPARRRTSTSATGSPTGAPRSRPSACSPAPGLAQYLNAHGVAFEPFEDLHDIREALAS